MAYSVYGHTVSLSGEPETDVVVEAAGQDSECDQYQEEAVSDAQGGFRIRGLYPKVCLQPRNNLYLLIRMSLQHYIFGFPFILL